MDLHVPRALELLEDDLVHAAAGVDEGGGQDGQAAAFLDVAGGAEEALRLMQRVGVHAAGQDLAGVRNLGVVGASQARDRVKQNDHVGVELDEALGLLDHHLADLHVPAGRLVERRANDLGARPLDRALHFGHFLGTLVDQEHDHVAFRMVLQNAVGDLLQEDGLAGARRGDDQAALPLADRRDQVHDAHVDLARLGFEHEPFVRVQRRQVVEDNFLRQQLGIVEVDRLDAQQCEVALVLLGRPNLPSHDRPRPQAETPDLARRDVDVVGARQVVVVRAAQEAEAVGQHFQRAVAEHQAVLLDPLLENFED